MPNVDQRAGDWPAPAGEHESAQLDGASGGAGLAQVAALWRVRLEERALGLAHGRLVAVAAGRRRRQLLREKLSRQPEARSHQAGGQDKRTAGRLFLLIHGVTSQAERRTPALTCTSIASTAALAAASCPASRERITTLVLGPRCSSKNG